MQSLFKSSIVLIAIVTLIRCEDADQSTGGGRNYYLNQNGDDTNEGTRDNPWKTISKANTVDFQHGDTLFLEGGQVFPGTLSLDSGDSGEKDQPIVITSYGIGKAIINAGNAAAIIVSNTTFVNVKNLHLIGAGRKEGNVESGLIIRNSCKNILADSIDIHGFQKTGLLVYASSSIELINIYAHDNGADGIAVGGYSKKTDSRDIVIRDCFVENNPGDPTNFTNHSGNGIIVGYCTNVLIEYCAATNNGWDMPRIGNGPVGIWAYEADSVTIQHCISYRNKTSKGGEDGGGFDLDGGVTNSAIQYCLSYENEGGGIGIFQYNGASVWKNNTIRFNISENDGLVSTAHAGIYIWNGSNKENEFTDCYIYNNIIYNSSGSAIRFATESKRDKFYYYNNIFVAKDDLMKGVSLQDTFLGNNWWSLSDGFNINGQKNFTAWIEQSGQEKKNGQTKGVNSDPAFENAEPTMITNPHQLPSFFRFKLPPGSSLRTKGVNLKEEFSIDPGSKDFNQNPILVNGIGSSF